MNSGLVSLNVHDSLTFDGVEIAINPEIFTKKGVGKSVSVTSSRHNHSRDSSFASASAAFPSASASGPSSATIGMVQDDATAQTTTAANNNNNNNTSHSHSHSRQPSSIGAESIVSGPGGSSGYSNVCVITNAAIQAGDIIEIQIWDKKPNSNGQSQSQALKPSQSRKSHVRGNTNVSLSSAKLRGISALGGGDMNMNDQTQLLANAASKLQSQQQQQQISQQSSMPPPPPVYHPLSKRPPLPIGPRGLSLGPSSPKDSFAGDFPFRSVLSDVSHDGSIMQVNSSSASTVNAHRTLNSTPVMSNIGLNPTGSGEIVVPNENENENRGLSVIQPNLIFNNKFGNGTASTNGPPVILGGAHSRISSLGSSTSNIEDPSQSSNDQNNHNHNQEDPLEQISLTHIMRRKFVASVTEKSLSALKAGGRTQISIMKNVADLYGLRSYDLVTVTKIDKSEEAVILANCQADFVTMTIKDQFVSRGELYGFQKSFSGKWIYEGERLSSSDGVRGTIMDIRHGNEEFKSAFITDDTKITCRSRSARIIWLVQISSEMWDYASPYENDGGDGGACEIYFDKFVSFMYSLFEEWTALESTHSLTVVFFSRSFILPTKSSTSALNPLLSNQSPAIEIDAEGRRYEDYFKVVIENETQSDWAALVAKIKRAFISFPLDVGWKLTSDYSRLPSFAAQGNILEAINTALNMLQLHYIDRDLHRVGNSIVVVSAGSGVFEVDKDLAAITKQRMMDNGIGSDMLSLGLPPLHVAPFMLFKEARDSTNSEQNVDVDDFDGWKEYFEIPHWMHLSFVNYERDGRNQAPDPRPAPDDPDFEDNHPKYVVSNGFIVRDDKSRNVARSAESTSRHTGLTVSQQQQRHLVVGRDFEDILEACRPRNRGDGGTPSTLMAQLKLFGLLGGKRQDSTGISNIIEGDEIIEVTQGEPKEWNSVDLDDPSLVSSAQSLLSGSLDASFSMGKPGSGSDLSAYSTHSPSSTFTNNLSAMLGRSPTGSISPLKHIQIQQSSSVDIPFSLVESHRGKMHKTLSNGSLTEVDIDDNNSHREGRSNSILSSCDSGFFSNTGQGKVWSLDAMEKAMAFHDSNVIYHEPAEAVDPGKRHVKATNLAPGAATEMFTPPPGTQDVQEHVGIGAAIREFDVTGNDSSVAMQVRTSSSRRGESTTVKTLKKSMNAASSNNLFQGHAFSRPTSLAFSLDENSAILGLNLSNHDPFNFPNAMNFLPGAISFLDNPQSLGKSLHEEKSDLSSISVVGKDSNTTTKKKIRVPSTRERKSKSKSKVRQFSSRKPSKSAPPPSQNSRRKQWVLNPFRQEDEDGVLATRTHNSRRWSHVFPKGEIEFKRHAGPNWKSLCQPAILPVTIDVYPKPKELQDHDKYSFNHYQVNLDAMDATYYTSRSDLLREMVRQRIVQDFQLVPQSVLARSQREVEKGLEKNLLRSIPKQYESSISGRNSSLDSVNIQHTLSMGHRIHIISSNSTSDSVDVVQYLAKNANNQLFKPFNYKYNLWMPMTDRYQYVSQIFQRFPEEYPFNRLDNLICGDFDKTLDSKTKYRRIAFCIIPDKFKDQKGEEAYITKAKKFLHYLENLAKEQTLDIPILSTNSQKSESSSKKPLPRNLTDFIVHARKQWFELAVGRSFDTRKTYRVIFKWLVASAIKVEAHITTLQRRCSQYKLNLVAIPEMSMDSNISLNPLKRPEHISISNPDLAYAVERALVQKFEFCDDGEHTVYSRDVEKSFAVKVSEDAIRWSRKGVQAQQYLHISGTLFVRILHDINESVTFVFLENRPLIGNNLRLEEIKLSLFRDISSFISEMALQKPISGQT